MKVAIITAQFSGGQPKKGVELGPQKMLDAGIETQLAELGHKTRIIPIKGPEFVSKTIGKMKDAVHVSKVSNQVAEAVKSAYQENEFPLTLGGDHSLGIGTLSGSLSVHPDLGVIWVDAHADINTPSGTLTGNLHGCPLSFLMGLDMDNRHPFEWVKPVLKANRLVYIGLRDLDLAEKVILKNLNIKAFSMDHIEKMGISSVVEKALDYLGPGPIHCSFDVDACDPSVCPSTGTSVRGGLTFREGHFICSELYNTGRLIALDIMEVNPQIGDSTQVDQTVQAANSFIRACLGESFL